MRLDRVLQTALSALSRNVMRAILTTLGIIIGIAAVIAMMEIGTGSTRAIQKTIASMGANSLLVIPGAQNNGGVSQGSGSRLSLTPDDSDAIIRECPDVLDAAPIIRFNGQVVYGNRNVSPNSMYGTTPNYLTVRDWNNMAQGAPFTDADVRNAAKVCLLGKTLATDLFDDESPVGKEIRVLNVTFKVIGVLSVKGANMMGQDQDDLLIAPWRTVKFRVSGNSSGGGASGGASGGGASGGASASSSAVNTLSELYPTSSLNLYAAASAMEQADTPLPVRFISVSQILASARTTADIPAAVQEIESLLRERHKIGGGEDDFQVVNLTEIRKAFTSTSGTMTTLLLVVACISLVVGGVGIMNIMLVSVTERTREIGLRMAVGARARDILSQFLAEAILLCLAGGIIGILLGVSVSWLVTKLAKWPTASSPTAIVVAFAVSALVGMIFGFYPAYKASRLDPIDALRYE